VDRWPEVKEPYCIDMITQVSAARAAVRSISLLLLKTSATALSFGITLMS